MTDNPPNLEALAKRVAEATADEQGRMLEEAWEARG